jgi:hypothetical protein
MLDPAIGEDDAGEDLRAAEVDADDAFPVQTARLPYWLTEASLARLRGRTAC